MSSAKELQKERTQLFRDIYDGKIPKRVPVSIHIDVEASFQKAGLPIGKTMWSLEGVEEALDASCERIKADAYPFGMARNPIPLQILGTRTSVMSSSGFIQHPEVVAMEMEEYDELIKNPYDFILEKVMPRINPALDTDPVTRSLVFAKAILAREERVRELMKIDAKLIEKHGYYITPPESSGMALAPFDYIADFLRGFTGMVTDVRRCPEKVAEACEAILPMIMKNAMPPKPSKYGQTFMPLHMAPYIRDEDFEKLYWPTFSRLVQALADAGQPVFMFCDHNWMRYLDYLYELPENTRIAFEFGDPKVIKEKLGKRHILTGLYPLAYLKTATKQQAIDKAKELLDIMAPGGRYYFDFDKSLPTLDSTNPENYEAVINYIVEKGHYSNAGEPVASDENTEKTFIKAEPIPAFKSKYYKTWEEYKAEHPEIYPELEPVIAQKLQMYEDRLFMPFFF